MSRLELASSDMRAGRFASALAHLRRMAATGPDDDDPAREAALAEVLYLTGDSLQAKGSATAAMQVSTCTKASRVRCLTVLGSVAWEAGDLAQSVKSFQKAKTLAKSLGDIERFCWIQLELVAKLADVSGPNAVVTLLEDCRTAVGLVGHPQLGARLHLSLAQVEGKRGLLEQAGFHLRAAESLLTASTNPWLEGLLFLNSSAVQLVMSPDRAGACQRAPSARMCQLFRPFAHQDRCPWQPGISDDARGQLRRGRRHLLRGSWPPARDAHNCRYPVGSPGNPRTDHVGSRRPSRVRTGA